MKNKESLSGFLFRRIFGIYLMVAISVTIVQLVLEYKTTKDSVRQEMTQVLETFSLSVSEAIWHYDYELVDSIAIGIMRLPIIDGINIYDDELEVILGKGTVVDQDGNIFVHNQAGVETNSIFGALVEESMQLQADNIDIGQVTIYSTSNTIIERIEYGFFLILINSLIKSLLLWGVFFYFMKRYLSDPLRLLTSDVEKLDSNAKGVRLADIQVIRDNELGVLQKALNSLLAKLNVVNGEVEKKNLELNDANHSLEDLNKSLEDEVKKRSDELSISIKELEKNSRLASLSQMVAGIAHELNTPLGVCVTSISILKESFNEIKALNSQGKLTKEQFEDFIELTTESLILTEKNIDRSASLVSRFKQIDQSLLGADSHVGKFKCKDLIESLLKTYSRKMHDKTVHIELVVEHDLEITVDPSVFSRLVTTLIDNSLLHGFKNADEKNTITMRFKNDGENYKMFYKDNGAGIDEAEEGKIFNPFYTTKRNDGGTGLGLNIVYNLVTNQLKGKISIKTELKEGLGFTILWPQDIV